ncbi:hypothetical protein ACIQNG_06245 [Streptomyces sp. NPDC091377]|uniref:hypothetical protein n=1 Tax=unclassified Streptomyces TaxID=2593676 RepID=UPI003829956B
MRLQGVRGSLAVCAVTLALAGTAAAVSAAQPSGPKAARYAVEYAVGFENPGESGDLQPYGRVYLRTKDGVEFTLWYEQRQGGGTPAGARYPVQGHATKNLFFPKDDIDQVCAFVDEYDTGDPDDSLAAACLTYTGPSDTPYTVRGADADSAVQVTVKRVY